MQTITTHHGHGVDRATLTVDAHPDPTTGRTYWAWQTHFTRTAGLAWRGTADYSEEALAAAFAVATDEVDCERCFAPLEDVTRSADIDGLQPKYTVDDQPYLSGLRLATRAEIQDYYETYGLASEGTINDWLRQIDASIGVLARQPSSISRP